jgi:hypothetical protein
MYIQCGCDQINKLVVGAVTPPDRRFQTVTKVQDDRIVGRNAGPYGKLDYSIGAVIVSQLIESGSRNEKVKAVGYIFGIGSRIKGQIDEAHCAMWEGDYLEPAFLWFASCEGIPLQGEDDPMAEWRRMVRRTRNEIRPAELRNLELASLQRPVSGGNRRLQHEEVASESSAFQSCGRRIRGSGRYSRLCNCQVCQLPLPRVKRFQQSRITHIIPKSDSALSLRWGAWS